MPAKRKPPHPISVTTPRTQLNTITSTLLEPVMQPATATVPTETGKSIFSVPNTIFFPYIDIIFFYHMQRHQSSIGITVVLVAQAHPKQFRPLIGSWKSFIKTLVGDLLVLMLVDLYLNRIWCPNICTSPKCLLERCE